MKTEKSARKEKTVKAIDLCMDLSNRLIETHSSETDVSAKGEEVFISSLQREKKKTIKLFKHMSEQYFPKLLPAIAMYIAQKLMGNTGHLPMLLDIAEKFIAAHCCLDFISTLK